MVIGVNELRNRTRVKGSLAFEDYSFRPSYEIWGLTH